MQTCSGIVSEMVEAVETITAMFSRFQVSLALLIKDFTSSCVLDET